MGIIGVGDYGIQAIDTLKQQGIRHVEYSAIDAKGDISRLSQLLLRDDVVFIIADISASFSAQIIPEIAEMNRESSTITLLLLRWPEEETPDSLLLSKLKGMADTLFMLPGAKRLAPDDSGKQIYGCVKALTDICGDRRGYANTDLGDIAGSIRRAGIGYIGYGEAKGGHAMEEAADRALESLVNTGKLQNAKGVIATISCQNCAIEDSLPFFDKIGQYVNDEVVLNYNIYPDGNPEDVCTVIILAVGCG